MDIRKVKKLIELLEESDINEIEIQEGEESLRISRASSVVAAPVVQAAPVAAAPVAAAPVAAAPVAEAPAAPAIDGHAVTSPMVGTFYSRANPESDPFVKVGDIVSEDTIVCIVEAMKVFNEIPAECSGKIVEVLVKDQEAIDFGKPMFRVEPN